MPRLHRNLRENYSYENTTQIKTKRKYYYLLLSFNQSILRHTVDATHGGLIYRARFTKDFRCKLLCVPTPSLELSIFCLLSNFPLCQCTGNLDELNYFYKIIFGPQNSKGDKL